MDFVFQKTLPDSDVGLLFREPFIKTGYRQPYRPWSYYIGSLFRVHNETLNVWSHLAYLAIFLRHVYVLRAELDYSADPLAWPMLGFAAGTIAYTALSAMAHLLQSRSEMSHYVCYQLDYAGIGLNAVGNGLLVYYMVATETFYRWFGWFFIPVNFLLGFFDCACMGVAMLWFPKPYPYQRKIWQMGSTGFHVLFAMWPLAHKIVETLYSQGTMSPSVVLPHAHYSAWFLFSVSFFASHVPERLLPGAFDMVGHGHQIFHLAVGYCSWLQYEVGLLEMKTRPRHLVAMANPNGTTIFGGILAVVLGDLIFLVCTHNWRKKICAEDVKRRLRRKKRLE
ncbi:hypothetical protein CAPTEDRAFT_126366 [Capitella teleta]|uniref:Uncharacterized protein n=1 Tax=Capitella teleta TaxID=283909 RepID=R7T8U0_CAPTE|nr:hypothetical protein CAPTEDRAFT_126366 [Capitella teleta]|eukprot:ELT90045.1 hypothetical protein CAPTEDRAFT_126366 [Capitella teleta]